MEVLRQAPNPSSFIPLVEHHSATPASFYEGPPVLHYYSDRSKLIILDSESDAAPALASILTAARSETRANGSDSNGESDPSSTQKVVEDVDVWVTSDKLFLYSNAASSGVSIPYPSISLHAIQTLPTPSSTEQQGVYLQIITSVEDAGDEDPEPESISVTIVPTAAAPPDVASERDPAEEKPEQTPVSAMFTALSNCSNLHPDPHDSEEDEDGQGSRLFQAGLALPGTEDGGLPPAMPGSGGWITAENMHEFVDENGNWIETHDEDGGAEEAEDTPLGPGAGNIRTRQEATDGQEDEEAKWRRTS